MRFKTMTLCLLPAIAALSTGATAQAAGYNILFYGNSFTNGIGGTNAAVPDLMKKVAVAAGKTSPSIENAAVNSQTLGYHIASNTSVISNPMDFAEPAGFKWDFVVMQEYSTKPTDIAGRGNPQQFKSDAQTLYTLVKNHSATVTPIMYETWARSPMSTDLKTFYPSETTGQTAPPYYAAADDMQAELRQYYGEAVSLLGTSARPAWVGDAFQAGGWTGYYGTDLYHASSKGYLLASLVLFETIYNTSVENILYSQMNSQLTLSNYGISNSTEWADITHLAHTTVPEPTCLGVLILGSAVLLRRCDGARRG